MLKAAIIAHKAQPAPCSIGCSRNLQKMRISYLSGVGGRGRGLDISLVFRFFLGRRAACCTAARILRLVAGGCGALGNIHM